MTGIRPGTINCTQCGAGLDVLGGGRVRSHICPYCSAELDAQHDYKVLRRYRDLRRPETPLSIGMTGTVNGVEVTVIGTIGMVETYKGQNWTWVNHQLYSPTHGYAWLTWEENRLVFTRKTRERPRPARLTERAIENADNPPRLRHEEGSFRYYGSGHVRVSFVEGEFNFSPRIGQETRYVSALGHDKMLTVREGAGEIEYEISSLPDQDALIESFGLDRGSLPEPRGVHPLEPFHRGRIAGFARNTAFAAAAVSLGLAFALGDPQVIHRASDLPVNQPYETAFTVTEGDRLVEIEVSANLANSWAFFEAEITDDEEEVVATFTRQIEYYFGRDKDGAWTEGSRWGDVTVKLPAGDYSMELVMDEAGIWRTGTPPSRMGVRIREGVIAWWWLLVGAAASAAFGGLFLFQRKIHNARRWSGSDWTDDD